MNLTKFYFVVALLVPLVWLQFVEQCGGSYLDNLIKISPDIWTPTSLQPVADAAVEVSYAEDPDGSQGAALSSKVKLLSHADGSGSSESSLSRGGLWFTTPLGLSDRNVVQFNLNLTDVSCGQIELYPGIFIDDLNDCGPQGFALVVSDDSVFNIGSFGSGLGYNGLRGVLAVEFDMRIDSVTSDDSSGKAYQISVIRRDSSTYQELIASETLSVNTEPSPSNFANPREVDSYLPNAQIAVAMFPKSSDPNILLIYVSVNNTPQLAAEVNMQQAGISATRLYTLGFTGTSYKNGSNRPKGTIGLDSLAFYKGRPLTTSFNGKIQEYTSSGVIIKYFVSALGSCGRASSIFAMPSTSASFQTLLAPNSTSICSFEGANPISTVYDANERSYAAQVEVLLKCSEGGNVSLQSSYSIGSSNSQLNSGFYQDVAVTSASFSQIFIVITAAQLTDTNFNAQGTTNQAYSFTIDILDNQNTAYLAAPNTIRQILNIEEPQVVFSSLVEDPLTNSTQKLATYQISTSYSLTPDSQLASSFTVTFTPQIQGVYGVQSSAFQTTPKYSITVNGNGPKAELSSAALTSPANSATPVAAGTAVELTLTLADTLGTSLSDPGACTFTESYYYLSSDSSKALVGNLTYANLRLSAAITSAGIFTLEPILSCPGLASSVLECEACQVTVNAATTPSAANTVIKDNGGGDSLSVVQGSNFVALIELRDQFNNPLSDTSSITLSSVRIQDPSGASLVTLSVERLSTSQLFVAYIESTASLASYRALLPRTQFYLLDVAISGAGSAQKSFDLIPSDFTTPPVTSTAFALDYRLAVLINPEGAIRAGKTATLFLQLRSTNLIDDATDRSASITLQFYENANGAATGSNLAGSACSLHQTTWGSAKQPGIYFLDFSCTTATNKWLRLNINANDDNDIFLPMKTDTSSLSLSMSGDPATFYSDEASLTFAPAITSVPFELRDSNGNQYTGEEGVKSIAYTFAGSPGVLSSTNGATYQFSFPYATPDLASYALTFSGQYIQDTTERTYTFAKTVASGSQQVDAQLSSCALVGLTGAALTIGDAAISVQCTLYTDEAQAFEGAWIAPSGFTLSAVNENGSSEHPLAADISGTTGVFTFQLQAADITTPGVYTIQSNVDQMRISNQVFTVLDTFALLSSTLTRVSDSAPLAQSTPPVVLKNAEYPEFMLAFKSSAGRAVDLSLVHSTPDQIRAQFSASIKNAADDSQTSVNLDFFSIGGYFLQFTLSNSATNRQRFDSLIDGLYYLSVSTVSSSDELKGYFRLQTYTLQAPSGTAIEFANTLLSPASLTVVSGKYANIYLEMRSSTFERIVDGLPAAGELTIAASSSTAASTPTLSFKIQEGPVQGSFVAAVLLTIADSATTLTFSTTGGSSLGAVTAAVIPGELSQLNGNGNTFPDLTVGAIAVYNFIPWDAAQNVIASIFSWRETDLITLLDLSHSAGAATSVSARATANSRIQFQISSEKAGILTLRPQLSTQSQTINILAERVPSVSYSYSDFTNAAVQAGSSTFIRVFLQDRFQNAITGFSLDERNQYTATLQCNGSVQQVASTAAEVGATGAVPAHLEFTISQTEACEYSVAVYYQSSKIKCADCVLSVSPGLVSLSGTVLTDDRGVPWTVDTNENPDMVFNINVDNLFIPTSLRDAQGNESSLAEGQSLTATFTSGTTPPPFCYSASAKALTLCNYESDWPLWVAFRTASSRTFRLTLTTGSSSTTANFRATVIGDASQDYDVESAPLNPNNTQVAILSGSRCRAGLTSLEGQLTLRTANGMRIADRIDPSAFEFVNTNDPSSSSSALSASVFELSKSGVYYFKISQTVANRSIPVALKLSAPSQINITQTIDLSIPPTASGVSASNSSLFTFSCQPGAVSTLRLYRNENVQSEVSSASAPASLGSVGSEYSLFVRGFDANSNQVPFTSPDAMNLKLTHEQGVTVTNFIYNSTLNAEGAVRVSFTPSRNGTFKLSSPLLAVGEQAAGEPANIEAQSAWEPSAKRSLIIASASHTASVSSFFQLWVEVRDAFDNYVDASLISTDERLSFIASVRRYSDEEGRYLEAQPLGPPAVAPNPSELNRVMLNWQMVLNNTGLHKFQVFYKSEPVSCRNCLTLVNFGALSFANTLFTYYDAVSKRESTFPSTLVLDNAFDRPSFRIYPRDVHGNLLTSFGSLTITATILDTITFSVDGGNSDRFLTLSLTGSSLTNYRALAKGAYTLTLSATGGSTVTRQLYLLGGDVTDSGTSNNAIEPQNTLVSLVDELVAVAGVETTFSLTLRVANGQRKNTFNAENNVFFFTETSSTISFADAISTQVRPSTVAGRFTIIFRSTKSTLFLPGEVYLRLRVDSVVVEGIRLRLSVDTAPPSALALSTSSINSGTTLVDGDASQGYSFKYTVSDQFGNAVSISASRSYFYDFSLLRQVDLGNQFVKASYEFIQDQDSGQVTCRMVEPVIAGSYSVESALLSSSYTFTINSGNAEFPYSTGGFSTSQPREITAGQESRFTIFARDIWSNPVTTDTSSGFQARIRTPSGLELQGLYDGGVSSTSDYIYVFVPTEAGMHRWVPFYGLLEMAAVGTQVNVLPGSLDLSGPGFSYYAGGVSASQTVWTPVVANKLKLRVGAPFRLRLDFVDQYGNRLLAPQISGITFANSQISGNDMAQPIPLASRVDTAGTEQWAVFEITDETALNQYNLLVGRAGYQVTIAAQNGAANSSTNLELEIVSALDESDASNGIADFSKTVVSPSHVVGRAGQVMEFTIELRTATGLRSVADMSLTLSDILVTNDASGEDAFLTTKVTPLEQRGQYKVDVVFTRTYPVAEDSTTFPYFQQKSLGLRIFNTDSQNQITFTPTPGRVDFSKTALLAAPTGTLTSGSVAEIKLMLQDQFSNTYIGSSLVLNRMKLYINGQEYLGQIDYSVETDGNALLGEYVTRFYPTLPPITWSANLYFLQDDFSLTPLYLGAFPTATFSLESVLTVAQTEFISADLDQGIAAGRPLEVLALVRDQFGYCFSDAFTDLQIVVQGPGFLDAVTDTFVTQAAERQMTISILQNPSSDCYVYYRGTLASNVIEESGTYFIQAKRVDNTGAETILGRGRTFTVFQGDTDATKTQIYFKITAGESQIFRNQNGADLQMQVGNPATFYLQTFDQYNNAIQTERFTSIVLTSTSAALQQGDFSYSVSYEFKNGTFPVTIAIARTGSFAFTFALNGVDVTSTINSAGLGPQNFVVSSGACKANRVVLPSLQDAAVFSCLQGKTCSFSITCRDVLDNALSVGGDLVAFKLWSVTLQDAPAGIIGSEVSATVNDLGTGAYTITFSPNYAGSYVGILYVNSIPLDTAAQFAVSRSICTSATPYLCYNDANETCVANYADCSNLNWAPCTNQAGKIFCEQFQLGACVSNRFDCDAPAGYTKCPATNVFLPDAFFNLLCYERFNLDCASISPDSPFQCADGTCRRDASECPSAHVCPPNTEMCPDFSCSPTGFSGCAYSDLVAPCTFPTPYKCFDSSCAADITSCPTGLTCSEPGYVVCPDNRCVPDETQCRQLIECAAGEVKCADGSCATSAAACPQRPSCGLAKGLCEDLTCRLNCVNILTRNLSQEGPRELQALSALTCGTNSIKCPTGECASNYHLCPSRIVCAAGLVKCSDESCARTVEECLTRSVIIPVGSSVFSCFDGSLVSALTDCPTRVSCPSQFPIKCHDDFCVADVNSCAPYVDCPASLPFRCWSGDCRRSVGDCPSAIHCPTELPVLCQDGSCHQTQDECRPIVEAMGSCASGQIRCSSGSCAAAKTLCPSLPTCSDDLNTLKCWDGRCVASLAQCDSPNGRSSTCSSASAPFRCPDGTCSSSYANCPSLLSCPIDQPVRCSDFSCRASVSDCSLSYTECPASTTPCPDGSCSYTGSCSVGVTCPAAAPYLCQDNTCRADLSDCVVIVTCPTTEFFCRNGDCVSQREDCQVLEACPPEKPTRCPDLSCYASATDCVVSASCPRGYTRCSDSSCKEDRSLCSEGTGTGDSICPRQAAVLCFDGSCSLASSSCPAQDNNCPFYSPTKCPNGLCAHNATACAPATNVTDSNCQLSGWKLCADGSCAPTANSCPQANGCASGLQYKCADGSCTNTYFGCPVHTCPNEKPVKCASGLCVSSARFCLDLFTQADYDFCATLDANSLVPCGDGSCLNNSEMCQPLYDCPTNYVRCGDGSCRQSSLLCPLAGSTCPPQRAHRCANGACATEATACPATAECPASMAITCPDGRCVASATDCTADTNQWTREANGCPSATPVRCWNEACVGTQSACPLPNLCPQDRPLRCGNGECFATLAECQAATHICPSGQVRCPDSTCAASWSACSSAIGCPMSTPFRCPDGSCAAVGNAVMGSSPCTPGVVCDDSNPFRCHSGQCKGQQDFCPLSLPYATCPGSSPVRCIDGSCAATSQECPSLACPPGAPYLCRNGQCASKVLECSSGTIGGCPSDEPILCISGQCVTTPALCVPTSIAKAETQTCPAELPILCYDGSCMNTIKNCPLLPSCTEAVRPYRCSNGECVANAANCLASTTSIGSCAPGTSKCEDGYCRETCPVFNGCPTTSPFQCPNGLCGQDLSDCAGTSNCPITTPFRCGDYSCKASTLECDLPIYMSKPSPVILTFNRIGTSTFELIYSPRTQVLQGELTIPPNALQAPPTLLLQQTSSTAAYLNIYPIADSELFGTYYVVPDDRVPYVRQYYTLDKVEEGAQAQLSYDQALVSAAIEIQVDEARYSREFAYSVSLSLQLQMPSFITRNQDICLSELGVGQQEWRCVERTHAFDSGSQMASFRISSVGRYAVLFAPNENFDTSSDYAICGSWSCRAPSDFLLLVFLGPLFVIIAILVAFVIFLYMKQNKRMKEELERNQEDLFLSGSELPQTPSSHGMGHMHGNNGSGYQDRSDMRLGVGERDEVEMAELQKRQAEIQAALGGGGGGSAGSPEAGGQSRIPRVDPYVAEK